MQTYRFRLWDGKQMDHGCTGAYLDREGVLVAPGGTVLMQYTGLDGAGLEPLYEGDIVQIDDNEATAVVTWDYLAGNFYFDAEHNEAGWCDDWTFADDSDRAIVLGNVYENEDLLG